MPPVRVKYGFWVFSVLWFRAFRFFGFEALGFWGLIGVLGFRVYILGISCGSGAIASEPQITLRVQVLS